MEELEYAYQSIQLLNHKSWLKYVKSIPTQSASFGCAAENPNWLILYPYSYMQTLLEYLPSLEANQRKRINYKTLRNMYVWLRH
jgi:hypothetical protein